MVAPGPDGYTVYINASDDKEKGYLTLSVVLDNHTTSL